MLLFVCALVCCGSPLACFSFGWCYRFIGLGLVCGRAEIGLFVFWLVLRGDFSVALLGLVSWFGLVSGSGSWLGRVVLVSLSLGWCHMLIYLPIARFGLVICVSFLVVLTCVGLFVCSSGRVLVSLSHCLCWSLGAVLVFGGAGLSVF